MIRYKIIISYDGTDFAGWQVQPNGKGIANVLQDRFAAVFNEKIKLVGASRTDAGVHARGQVAIFSTNLSLDHKVIKRAWNDALPPSIVIQSLEETPSDFHPRYGVKQKTYHYHFFLERPSPFVERYGWFFTHDIDTEKLNNALALFVGEHDFRSFCTGDEMDTTIRSIDEISVEFNEKLGAHRITFKARGFLRYMIRRIVGACMEVASKDVPITILTEALEKKDPKQNLHNAPAKGLCLESIRY